MFSIKEVANNLSISTQAIYKQKDYLTNKGFMVKNNQNNWEITDAGFNYLQDKKVNFIQQHKNNNINQVANQVEEKDETKANEIKETLDFKSNDRVANIVIQHYKSELQTVTNQLQEMTQQRDYFKAKFEEKDDLCNQYMNSHLLPPTETEKETLKQESKNKGFFSRFFKHE